MPSSVQGINGREYVEYNQVLSSQAVQALTAYNQIGSPLRDESYDARFVRLMVIALFTTEQIAAKQFPRKACNMMERLFSIRVNGSDERNANFDHLFDIALKEAIVRHSKYKEKLNKIQLPQDLFDRKKK